MKGNEANWARRVSASATWHYRRGSCEVDRAKCAPNRRAFRRRDNNFIERQIKPWAMGRKAWLFCGSELAGQRAAIQAAIREAKAGDMVLIAGKGHEDYQIVGTTKHHFDDREVAREMIGTLRS